jgi:hypothetical protein
MSKELQSFDCKNLIKKESRTTKRYQRETAYKIAQELNFGWSRSTYVRARYIEKFGSEEIRELVKTEQISIWKAYKFVRTQQIQKALKLIGKV